MDIYPHERTVVAKAVLVQFGLLAGHTLVETARDALFLGNLDANYLPWVYLLIALAAVMISHIDPGGGRRRRLTRWLVLVSGVTAGFWYLSATPSPWVLFSLYVWSALAISLSTVQFWLVVNRMFSLDQAKRVFGVITAGSVLGAIAGAALGHQLSSHFEVRHLLLVGAACFLGSGLLVPSLKTVGPRRAPVRVPQTRAALRRVLRHPYTLRLAGLTAVSTVTFTVVDFIFKSQVASSIPAAELGTFFAGYYAVINILSLLVQVLLTGAAIRTLSVRRVVLVQPLVLLFGALGVLAGGGMAAVLALKTGEGSLKHTLHRTTSEVLYVPLSESLRPHAKLFIDVVVQRSAQAVSAILTLVIIFLGGQERPLALLTLVLCIAWVLIAHDLRRHYLNRFRRILKREVPKPAHFPVVDLEILETLMGALNSVEDAEVLSAMEILSGTNRTRLIPALILHHPSQPVVLRALHLFHNAERTDYLPIARRLGTQADPEIRSALVCMEPDLERIKPLLREPQPLVQGSALIRLVAAGGTEERQAWPIIHDILQDGTPQQRIGLAKGIVGQRASCPAFVTILLILSGQAEPTVQAAAAEAMAVHPDDRFIETLIRMLGSRRSRAAAHRALVAIPLGVVETLGRFLADRSIDVRIRGQIPRTLRSFPNRRTMDILLTHLLEENHGMVRYKILRVLNQMHWEHPSLRLDPNRLQTIAHKTVRNAYILMEWRLVLTEKGVEHGITRTPGHELLIDMIQAKINNVIERLFRLLELMVAGEDFEEIFRGIQSKDRKVVASSLELMENLLPSPLREGVIGLVDPSNRQLSNAARLRLGSAFHQATGGGYEETLEVILKERSISLRELAAYHVGELGLHRLRPVLVALAASEQGFAAEVVTHALEKLDAQEAR